MDIGSKLKRLRVLAGLTQEELADRAELSKGFISQLENNITSPSIATLLDILQCLGVQIKDFFDEETETQVVFTEEDYFIKEDKEYRQMDNTECTKKYDGTYTTDYRTRRAYIS